MKEPSDNPDDDEADRVAQLIRGAGRRVEPPAAAYRRTLQVATSAWRTKVRRRRYSIVSMGVAAGLVLAIGATLFVRTRLPQRPVAQLERIIGTVELRMDPGDTQWKTLTKESQSLRAGSLLRTRTGSRAGARLAGGVSLRLAEATEVAVESASRIRLRSGKMYIDTGMEGQESRIEVITAAGIVRDIGTQFEVSSAERSYRLRVREGRVVLKRGSLDIPGAGGEQLIIDAAGNVQRTQVASDDPQWEWVESIAPAPQIDGKPVAFLLAWVKRETGRALKYATPQAELQVGQTILHGNIRNLAPLQALEVMLATTDLEHVILPDGTILIRLKSSA